MWDIPALIQSAIDLWKEKVKRSYPEEAAKDLENEKQAAQYAEKLERENFLARMRRFLAGLKILLIVFLLSTHSCIRENLPLTPTERQQYRQALEENKALKSALQECLDHLEKCE